MTIIIVRIQLWWVLYKVHIFYEYNLHRTTVACLMASKYFFYNFTLNLQYLAHLFLLAWNGLANF